MTLSERNAFFKAGIVFCAVCTLLILAVSLYLMPQYPNLNEDIPRPSKVFQSISGIFFDNNLIAVHISLVLSVVFSLVGMILIYSFFERTSAPEILYIAIFTISFAFEALRLILPMQIIFNFPSFYLLIAFRVLLFARFFCIFSLFAASVCAAGLEVQKVRNIILIIIIAVLIIIMGVPIDFLNWDTALNMVNGFNSMFRVIELITFLTTLASFLIAAKNRGSKEYNNVAIGIAAALVGRNILLNTDNWLGPILGILLLSFGTWFLCSKLHKIHLWL
jgi:hypothetical protein